MLNPNKDLHVILRLILTNIYLDVPVMNVKDMRLSKKPL